MEAWKAHFIILISSRVHFLDAHLRWIQREKRRMNSVDGSWSLLAQRYRLGEISDAHLVAEVKQRLGTLTKEGAAEIEAACQRHFCGLWRECRARFDE